MLVTVVSLRRKFDYGQSINEKRSVADDFDDENVDEKAERNTFLLHLVFFAKVVFWLVVAHQN